MAEQRHERCFSWPRVQAEGQRRGRIGPLEPQCAPVYGDRPAGESTTTNIPPTLALLMVIVVVVVLVVVVVVGVVSITPCHVCRSPRWFTNSGTLECFL